MQERYKSGSNSERTIDSKCLVNSSSTAINSSKLALNFSNKFEKEIKKKKMGKVVFINPSLDYESEDARTGITIWPYPGLMILQSVLVEAGYDAQLIDSNLYKKVEFRKKLFSAIDDETIFVGFGLLFLGLKFLYSILHSLRSTGKKPNLYLS